MSRIVILLVCMIPGIVLAWPWSTDMMNQPSIKPQEGTMKPFPKRSIPVGGLPTKVKNREEARNLVNPVKLSEASVSKGRNLFKIYCAACHGLTGKLDTPIAGKIGAIDLTDSYVQEQLTEGWLFGTISFGSAIMPAYGVPANNAEKRGSNDLTVEERWHVVNYLKNALVADSKKKQMVKKASQ